MTGRAIKFVHLDGSEEWRELDRISEVYLLPAGPSPHLDSTDWRHFKLVEIREHHPKRWEWLTRVEYHEMAPATAAPGTRARFVAECQRD